MNCSDYRNAVSSIVWTNAQRQSLEQKLCGAPSGTIADTAQRTLPRERLIYAVILLLGILSNWLLKWLSRILI